ncbi:MAG: DUF1284 domain-containing protein [Xanthomonadaceae bacterium]|nr:DUF1284 domain-containing protein [Xanthomonadaceae bacterium]
MTIKLRSHHLLCILSYMGMGHTPTFVLNFNAIAQRIREGEDIWIVAGPDDICAPFAPSEGELPRCPCENAAEKDRLAAEAITSLLGRPVTPETPFEFNADILAKMRAGFSSRQIRQACSGCDWETICDAVSLMKYQNALVFFPPPEASSSPPSSTTQPPSDPQQ